MYTWVFDPNEGAVVRTPLGSGAGWWAGAPGAFYDEREDTFWLVYRYRRPRGVEPDRGAELIVASSDDGVTFHDRWRMTKDAFGSPSVERACLRRLPDGTWRLWVSYVDPDELQWRIDVMRADSPEGFQPSERSKVFTAAELGVEGVKDPWVFGTGAAWWMVTSFAARAPGAEGASADELHHHADAYDTGLILAHSGLAVSVDAEQWTWLGDVLQARGVGRGWDGYSSRIACVLRDGAGFTAYYDGAVTTANHYDEPTALASSFDLLHWTRLSPQAPLMKSPYGLGCCRYFDAVDARGKRHVYYELGRADGGHDLRVIVLSPGGQGTREGSR